MKEDAIEVIGIFAVIAIVLIIIGLIIVALFALIGFGLKIGGLMNLGIIQGFIASFPFS